MDNNVAIRGGAIENIDGPVIVSRSTISHNKADDGGGFDNIDGGILLVNSTLSGNMATNGGGMRNQDGGALLLNSTVTDNGGGGILNIDSSSSLANTIVAHQASGNDCININGTIVSQGYNLDSDGSCLPIGVAQLEDQANTDAKIGSLEDNGGATLTHALLRNSPALEGGNTETCTNGLVDSKDQRGLARPQGINCDIGAFEFQYRGADLGVTKHDIVDPVMRGQNIEYAITVTNYGPEPATNVVLVDILPGGMNLVSVHPGSPTCTVKKDEIRCELGDLANGASSHVTIIAATTNGTSHYPVNKVQVSSSTKDATPGNNSESEETLVCDFIATDELSLNAGIACANAAATGIHTVQIDNDIKFAPPTDPVDEQAVREIITALEKTIEMLRSNPNLPIDDATLMEIVSILLTAPDTLLDHAAVQEVILFLFTAPNNPLENVDFNLILNILISASNAPISQLTPSGRGIPR